MTPHLTLKQWIKRCRNGDEVHLVERLRNGSSDPFKIYAVCDEAADRIEALEAALRYVQADPATPYTIRQIARAALAPEQKP